MTREELLNVITELGTIEDPAERRSKIVTITNEINAVYDSNETLTADKTKLEGDKKKLQEYNMELYLQVGSKKEDKKEEDPEDQTEELKYEDLFNDKGELK